MKEQLNSNLPEENSKVPQNTEPVAEPLTNDTNAIADETKQETVKPYIPEKQEDDYSHILDKDFFENDAEETVNIYRAPKAEKQKKKKSKTKNFGTIVWVLIIVVLSILLAAVIVIFSSEYLGIGFGKGGECVVEIEKGMSTAQISDRLKDAGAINNSLMFRIYSKLTQKDGTYMYGVYKFTNELGYSDLATMLQTEGAKAETVRITIPEGANMSEIIDLLVKNNVCTKSDFRNAVLNGDFRDFDFIAEIPTEQVYYQLEGYLFPDTYDFYCYENKAECAELAIRKMLTEMDKQLTSDVRSAAKEHGYNVHELLTMASIVEMEASSAPNEMPKVSAVFYNRLHWDEPHFLGSSPTTKYPFGNGRYDTNKHEGLPPGPMCAPSANAIKAAANPTKNFSATYFVTDSDMKFYYNNTLSAHNKTIAGLKAKHKWVG